MRWRDVVEATNRCVYCFERFHEDVSWSWMLGMKQASVLCPRCEGKMVQIDEISCEMCGRPSNRPSGGKKDDIYIQSKVSLPPLFVTMPEHHCSDCLKWDNKDEEGNTTVQHRALYVYNSFMQEMIAKFKYRGDVEIAQLFSGKLKKLSRQLGEIDVVTVIPLKEDRLWERGFNQAALLAKEFALTEVLERTGTSEKQSKRDRQGRIEALEGAFCLSEKGKNIVWNGKRILIIDDIYTTGATVHAAARQFYIHGALEVFAITIARAEGSLKVFERTLVTSVKS